MTVCKQKSSQEIAESCQVHSDVWTQHFSQSDKLSEGLKKKPDVLHLLSSFSLNQILLCENKLLKKYVDWLYRRQETACRYLIHLYSVGNTSS